MRIFNEKLTLQVKKKSSDELKLTAAMNLI